MRNVSLTNHIRDYNHRKDITFSKTEDMKTLQIHTIIDPDLSPNLCCQAAFFI